MSLERAKAYLKKNIRWKIRSGVPVSSATVELAAEALHTGSRADCKDFVFSGGRRGGADRVWEMRIDNAKYKAFFRAKAKMLCAG